VYFGIQDDGKSPEKFCEFCALQLHSRTQENKDVPFTTLLFRVEVFTMKKI
jgi:hypothetical protein